ncbi:hypothetical protein MALU111345_21515 [Marinicrinis lubricantis]
MEKVYSLIPLTSIFKWVISNEMMDGLARYPDLFTQLSQLGIADKP